MMRSVNEHIGRMRRGMDAGIFLPLFLVLTLAACLNAYQLYAPSHQGVGTVPLFLRVLGARLVYCWYFLLLAAVVERNSRALRFSRRKTAAWIGLHGATLAASFFVHESITLGAEAVLLGRGWDSALIILLFNNPAIWIEIFVYVLLVLFFSLREYRRIGRENEQACAELEARLTTTKLTEMRSRIQPAFLFSTLETIQHLVHQRRNEDANHILALLGDFLRTTVYENGGSDESASEGEAGILTHYSEIESLRSRQLDDVRREIERIVHEDQDSHHR